MSIESISKQVIEGNKNRRHFERTPEQLANQILDEAQELVHEIQEALITGNPWLVAGEIGDLYILLAQLCVDVGISPEDAMQMKVLRNAWKYTDYVCNNGYERSEALTMSKKFYSEVIGGDQAFSHAYLDILCQE